MPSPDKSNGGPASLGEAGATAGPRSDAAGPAPGNVADAQRTVERAGSAHQPAADVPSVIDAQRLAERAAEALFARDTASQLLGYHLTGASPGGAQVRMTVRHDMVNGHRTCHGGLIFTLADSAFAAACNSHNESNVAAAASIDFLAPAREGDELTAVATEQWRAGRTGIYEIKVTNQRGELIALFRGRSHRIGGAVTD